MDIHWLHDSDRYRKRDWTDDDFFRFCRDHKVFESSMSIQVNNEGAMHISLQRKLTSERIHRTPYHPTRMFHYDCSSLV